MRSGKHVHRRKESPRFNYRVKWKLLTSVRGLFFAAMHHGLGEVAPEKLTGTVEVDEVYIGGQAGFQGSR
jgi:hypothetical protein